MEQNLDIKINKSSTKNNNAKKPPFVRYVGNCTIFKYYENIKFKNFSLYNNNPYDKIKNEQCKRT
jgi:hypothetical protein